MLRALRRRLTVLNAAVSGVILLIISLGALLFTRAQFIESAANAFAHTADTIAYQLQSDTLVRHSYLSNTELSQGLLLYIEDGGSPFQWKGAYASVTPRVSLTERARSLAAENGVFMDYAPMSPHNWIGTLKGDYGDAYRVSVWVLPEGRGWSSIVILRDMREENAVLARIAWIFLGCAMAGVTAQACFSHVFAGRAIRPVERAQREQKRFVQAASHELRTPLAVTRASADALAKADTREAEAFIGAIRQQNLYMTRLVDDLLLLAGADAQALPMSAAPVDIGALLREAAAAFEAVMRERSIIFMYESVPNRVIMADAARLKQALFILLDNAAEYTPPGGSVTLSYKEYKDTMKISVTDSGAGVPDEHKEHIFERFYRADKARSRAQAHYGLGLSVAREIVSLRGGRISVQDAAGGGAAFSISLPMG